MKDLFLELKECNFFFYSSAFSRREITGRNTVNLDKAVAEIGRGAIGIQGDTSNLRDLDRLYATVREKAGNIDLLPPE